VKKFVVRGLIAAAGAAPLLLVGSGLAAAAPADVTAWDLGIATAVEMRPEPGKFCVTAPQGLPVAGYVVLPKFFVPPVIDGVGGITVVCVPGAGAPAEVMTGIQYTPLPL
jgi:hypothetical protein